MRYRMLSDNLIGGKIPRAITGRSTANPVQCARGRLNPPRSAFVIHLLLLLLLYVPLGRSVFFFELREAKIMYTCRFNLSKITAAHDMSCHERYTSP